MASEHWNKTYIDKAPDQVSWYRPHLDHSLAVIESTLPPEIEVTGRTESGVVMAMRHRTLPIEGVQFHPESVLTQGGHVMLANWLAAYGFAEAAERAPALAAEVEARRLGAFAA